MTVPYFMLYRGFLYGFQVIIDRWNELAKQADVNVRKMNSNLHMKFISVCYTDTGKIYAAKAVCFEKWETL